MLMLQFLHFPFKITKDIKGILSNQLISFLQFLQKDLPFDIFLLLGILKMQTFEKLPNIQPTIKMPM